MLNSFKTFPFPKGIYSIVAQRLVHPTVSRKVAGSNPVGTAIKNEGIGLYSTNVVNHFSLTIKIRKSKPIGGGRSLDPSRAGEQMNAFINRIDVNKTVRS